MTLTSPNSSGRGFFWKFLNNVVIKVIIQRGQWVRKGGPADVFQFCWLLSQWGKMNSNYFGMSFREIEVQALSLLKLGISLIPHSLFIFFIFPAVAASLG